MSIARLALRLATVQALSGQTLAGSRVVDSSIDSLEDAVRKEPGPVILVFSDEASGTATGRDLLTAGGQTVLAIEIIVAGAVEAEGGGTTIMVPPTDAGLEITLDLIERQVRRALIAPAPAWAEMWRQLVARIDNVKVVRGAGSRKGVRYAARRIEVHCEPLSDPMPGGPAEYVWADFLALMEADTGEDGLADLAPLVRVEIEGDTLSDWAQVQAALGLTLSGVRGIGVAPYIATGEDAAELAEVIASDEDGYGDLVMDEQAAGEQWPDA